jgi:hypothetical protein
MAIMGGWETKDIIVVCGMILTVITNGALAFLNHRLGRIKYRQEKLWDLRRDAYSEILSNLADAERLIGLWNVRSGDSTNDYYRKAYDAFEQAQHLLAKNYIICTEDFKKEFQLLQSKFPSYIFLEGNDQDIEIALHGAQTQLLWMARRELNI